jgi:hypothetical protein
MDNGSVDNGDGGAVVHREGDANIQHVARDNEPELRLKLLSAKVSELIVVALVVTRLSRSWSYRGSFCRLPRAVAEVSATVVSIPQQAG